MSLFEFLAQAEGYLSLKFLSEFSNQPKTLTDLWPKDRFDKELKENRVFKQIYKDLEDAYVAAKDFGLNIEPDSFGGFCLRNKTGHTIKTGEIMSAVGLIAKLPAGWDLNNWSVMQGEKLLLGVARWANHSCRANCDYYMKGGFRGRPCVRLRALRPILPNEELCTFYNEDVFGVGNCDCLCGHSDLHAKNSEKNLTQIKKFRRSLPRIQVVEEKSSTNELQSFIQFFDEGSNLSIQSFEDDEINQVLVPNVLSDDSFEFLPQYKEVEELDQTEEEILPSREDASSDENLSNSDEDVGNFSGETSQQAVTTLQQHKEKISEMIPVSSGNLAASLLSIVAQYNGPDLLLIDLLKRDQALFGSNCVAPRTLLKQLKQEAETLVHSKKIIDEGEIVFLNFRVTLCEIVEQNFSKIVSYAENKISGTDIRLPQLKIDNDFVEIRLVINCDGASVSKSPATSAWPLFIAIADLPPILRQSFKNIALAALFVGVGHPNFNDIFDYLKTELAVVEKVRFQNRSIKVKFCPLFFLSDLTGKSKVLNMKQCNGYYGCTICKQRGYHKNGAHFYPHDEKIELRSLDSYLDNLRALEDGSQERLKAKHGRYSDFEILTQGVKGRSSIFSVIPNQPLTSPIDVMHQLMLGVSKDLLSFY